MNASLFNQEANIEEPYFFISLEVEEHDSSSCDVDDEKEMTNGFSIAIDDDSLTDSLLFMSSIIDSEIYVPYPSHFVHTSLFDGAQLNVFQDVCYVR